MNKYIIINKNLWYIYGEISNQYRIKSRMTETFIDKDKCYKKSGSILLYSDLDLEIDKSNIQIEGKQEFEEYLEYLEGNLIDELYDDSEYFEDCFNNY